MDFIINAINSIAAVIMVVGMMLLSILAVAIAIGLLIFGWLA